MTQTMIIEVGPNLRALLAGAGTLLALALFVWAFFKD